MNFKSFKITDVLYFLVLASLSAARLTRHPADSYAVTRDTVRIECFAENKDYPPSWSHIKVGSTQPNDVYLTMRLDGQETIGGRMTVEYYERFKVIEDRTTGEYSLEVTNIQPGDAGRYTCAARGGLGQQASAELGVIDPYPLCASNATEVIGENICNHEPDHIELSCSFRYKGNLLPKVNWVKTDRPGQVVRIAEAQVTDDTGEAASKFVVKADTDDLNGTSFTCIVSSPSVADESRLRCTTPVINVLKITNLTESRRVDQQEEVQCNRLPHLQDTGCRWVKRKLEEDIAETVVAEGPLLNLFRPEFHSGGIYVCIVECTIRGQPCPVEALTIIYEPIESKLDKSTASLSTSNIVVIIIVGTLLVTACVIVTAFILYRKFTSKNSTRSAGDRATLDSIYQSTGTSYRGESVAGPEGTPFTAYQNSDSSPEGSPVVGPESTPLSGSGDDIALDITDSTRLLAAQGDRARRNRLAEERAEARMRKNAAMRQVSANPSDTGDVAEGIRRSPEESKDE